MVDENQPTVEMERDNIFRQGTPLREQIVAEIGRIHKTRASFKEFLFRTKIRRHEQTLRSFIQKFLGYEDRVSSFIRQVATARQTNNEPITLNTKLTLAIYVTQVSSQRDTIRSLLESLREAVATLRIEAGSRANHVVSMSLLLLAVLSLFVAVSSYRESNRIAETQSEASQIQQRALDASLSALQSVVKTSEEQQALLDQSLQASQRLLAIIQAQYRMALEQPDVHLELLYPQGLSVVVTNKSSTKAARDVLYEARFFNLGRKGETGFEFVSSVVEELEAIRPTGSFGPYRLKFRPMPPGDGDRLFGYVTVQCPECMELRLYWVYLVVAQEGWYVDGSWKDYSIGEQLALDKVDALVKDFLARKDLLRVRF